MTSLWATLRYTWRVLARNPGFAVVAVLTLALAIGASTAMFSVLDAVLIRPLPYPGADRLVMIWDSDPRGGMDKAQFREGSFLALQGELRSFEDLAAFIPPFVTDREILPDTIWGTSRQITYAVSTGTLLSMLGVRPILGRSFLPEDAKRGAAQAAILSQHLWEDYYQSDPDIIGQTLVMDRGRRRFEYLIVGVAPDSFEFPYPVFRGKPDVWLAMRPVALPPGPRRVRGEWLMGRLKPGVTSEQARAEVQAIADRLAREHWQAPQGERIRLVTLDAEMTAGVRTLLWVLFGAVGFLLLIACANVGNMLLARGVQREREVAIRLALGASRAALLRQMLVESAALGLVGGALGIVLAAWMVKALVALAPANLYVPRLHEVAVDGAVLAYALAASLAAALIFGLMPAWRAVRTDVESNLRCGVAGRTGRGSTLFRRPGSVLLVSELALAMVLLTGSFLMIRSLHELLTANRAHHPQNLITMSFSLSSSAPASGDPQLLALYEDFLERARAIPGVESVTLASSLPGAGWVVAYKARGGSAPISESFLPAETLYVMPEAFAMLGARVIEGRMFDATDRAGSPPVVIINEAMARQYWRDESPVGASIYPGPEELANPADSFIVAGVVREPRRLGTGAEPSPAVFFPMTQVPIRGSTILARTPGDPRMVTGALRTASETILPGEVRTYSVRTGDEIVARSTSRLRFTATLLGAFAGMALVLAGLGVYGLMAYFTAQRTREIGLRMALGAQRGDVLRLVVGQSARLALAGVMLGVAAALALTRVLRTMLYEVSPVDPPTFLAVALLLLGVAVAACWLPARRATRIDPLVALRHD